MSIAHDDELSATTMPEPPAAPAQTPIEAVPAHGTPRVRWAAIIWGTVFATLAALALWIASAAERRELFAGWATSLTPATIGGTALLSVGLLVLLLGAIGLIRRVQRRSEP